MSEAIPEQYRPRRCHVVKWPEFNGYGFNLHAEKGKAGQFIGQVDENSPAEASGLREGDRIVEVNGVNIGNENHQQVVTRIKSGGNETTLLVVDSESDKWFKDQKRVIRGDLADIISKSAKRETTETEEPPEPQVPEPEPVVEQEPEPAAPEPEPEVVPEPVVAAVAASTENGVSSADYEHRPRQCHLRIWPTFQGYGFNLHGERDKPGQFIGQVDDNSPSSTGGLRVNDRIVEVNGANVEREAHGDVIARIKAVPGETRLLVVDRETDAYYREKGVTVSSSMPQTEFIETPLSAPDEAAQEEEDHDYATPVQVQAVQQAAEEAVEEKKEEEEEEKKDEEPEVVAVAAAVVEVEKAQEEEETPPVEAPEEVSSAPDVIADAVEKAEEEEKVEQDLEQAVAEVPQEVEATFVPPPPPAEEPEPEGPVNGLKSEVPEPEYTVATHQQAQEPPRPEPTPAAPPATSSSTDNSMDGLELNMSVQEMKERLKAKKRQDPRLNKIPFEQKYKQFQRM